MDPFDSNKDAKNNGYPQSSPDALHIWKRFRKENKELAPNQDKDKENKKLVNNKRQTNQRDDFNSSSNSSLDIFKRTVAQEKLFRLHCENRYKKTEHSSSSSSSTDSSLSSDRQRRYLTSDDSYNVTNQEHSVNMTGVLHLKKPLSINNGNNDEQYYGCARMPPIDWNEIASSSPSQNQQREKIKKAETQKETITTSAKSKPQVSDEFSNFVENSVSYKIAYNKEGNIKRRINAIDSPIFKIHQRISKRNLETIRIPAAVSSSFFNISSDSHLLNRVDTFRAIDPMAIGNSKSAKIEEQAEKYKRDSSSKCNEPEEDVKQLKEGSNHVVQSAVDQVESKHEDWEVKKDKQAKNDPPTHVCDDYDRITYVDTLTDEENAVKRESRKIEMAYEDHLFTFVQNPPESSSSKINSSLLAPSGWKKNPHSFPFDKIKALYREKKFNKTMDSDDTLNVSSDLNNSSVCTVSTRARFEEVKRKMNKITSSCNDQANGNSCLLPDDRKVLENKNKLLNRCIRASHDYLKAPENNVVEITEVKVGLRPEPLMKPISTRYFEKSLTDAKESNDININNNVSIESSGKKDGEGHVDNRSNGNINNSFSSNVLTEKKLDQKDWQMDSGFGIKSTDSSSNSENNEMDCGGFIDYDAFDIENAELFFPALTVENLKKTISSRMMSSGMSIENEDPNNRNSLENKISNNNYSAASASSSSNLNSDSEDPPSPTSQFNFNNNIFENVNIEFSTLKIDGLDYGKNQTQEIEFNNPTSSLKNQNAHLALHRTSEIINTDEKIQSILHEKSGDQKHTSKEDSEQNFINNNNVASSQNIDKSNNENVAVAPKPVSKKMQKYRSTLENYKKKCKPEAEAKEEDINVQQLGNYAPQIENSEQKPRQRLILKEIQKLNITFKSFV